MGRPKGSRNRPELRFQTYNPSLGAEICKRLAAGQALNEICKLPGMPPESTVRGWSVDPEHPFAKPYVHARMVGYMKMADDILIIADDSSRDQIRREDGTVAFDHEHINRARLRVDARKWILAKALPKIFGDKTVTEHVGADGGPIEMTVTSTEKARRVAFMLARAAAVDTPAIEYKSGDDDTE